MNSDIYKEKLKKLPPWVQDYLDSMQSAEYNVIITEKYGLKSIEETRKYLDLVNQIFFKELLLISLFSKIKELFGFDDDKARAMAIDIVGMKLLPVEEWLDKNLRQYIRDLGGDPVKYEKYIEEHDQALEVEEEYFDNFLGEEEDDDQDSLLSEENIGSTEVKVKDIFSDKLADLLKWNDYQLINDVNGVIIYLLSNNDQVFKNELINLLMTNNRIITEKVFVLNGKDSLGTIGNWIKDFISKQGSDMFNVVTLSDFINNSENGKILDSEERDILTRVLITYRNLKFFPDSIENGKFEIIAQSKDPLTEEENVIGSYLDTGLDMYEPENNKQKENNKQENNKI
ncbi:MAG: hypothetical protein V1865_01145 [bacterium]